MMAVENFETSEREASTWSDWKAGIICLKNLDVPVDIIFHFDLCELYSVLLADNEIAIQWHFHVGNSWRKYCQVEEDCSEDAHMTELKEFHYCGYNCPTPSSNCTSSGTTATTTTEEKKYSLVWAEIGTWQKSIIVTIIIITVE